MTALLLAASCVGALQASLLWEDFSYAAYDIVTDGSVAYVATGNPDGVVAVDMSDPRSPTVLGVCGDMAAKSLALSGSMVYAVGRDYGMVCDVSTPSSPVVVGSFACPEVPWYYAKIIAAGTNLYLRDGYKKVYVYDATDASRPTVASTYEPPNNMSIADIEASGEYLYVAVYDDELQVVDASDPAAPTLVGGNTDVYLSSLLVSGTILYAGCMLDGTYSFCLMRLGYPVASTVSLVGSIDMDTDNMALSGTVLYVENYDNFTVVDVSNPLAPTVVGKSEYDRDIKGMMAIGTTVLSVSYYRNPSSLFVTDLSVPSQPQLIGEYGDGGKADGVYVAGSLAVVCDKGVGTVTFYNVSNPSAAAVLSVLLLEGNLYGRAYKPVIVGQHAYVSEDDGLRVVDITNPLVPTVTGELSVGTSYSLWVGGQLAYLAYSEGLHIADVSDATNPHIIGTLELNFTSPTKDVTVVGTTAYLVGGLGLVTVDVSYPLDPRRLGSVYIPGTACGVCVSGGVAYVAAGSGGLHVVDVSNAAAPTLLRYYDTGDARKVRVEGGLVYVADAKNGLLIFDVSDPPVLLDTAATNGVARDVYAVGTKVYVAARGLRIFDVSEATPLPTTGVPGTVAPVPTTSVPGTTNSPHTLVPGTTMQPVPVTMQPSTIVPGTTMRPSTAPVPQEDAPTPDAPGKEKEDTPSWVWAVVVVGALGVLGGAAVACYYSRRKVVNVSAHYDYVAQPGVLNEELVNPAV